MFESVSNLIQYESFDGLSDFNAFKLIKNQGKNISLLNQLKSTPLLKIPFEQMLKVFNQFRR
jgi:hypothetical protein